MIFAAMAYYKEVALALSDHVPEARQTETWFFQNTAAGKGIREARDGLKASGEKFWFYPIPFTQK